MSIPMQLLLIVAAFSVCFSEGAPDGRIARAKQQRPTRGFKNLEMMTARGFGKRGRPSPRTEPDQTPLQRTYRLPTFRSATNAPNFAIGNGKRTTEMEPEADFPDQSPLERTPILERIQRTPTFTNKTPYFAIGPGKRATERDYEDEEYRIRRTDFKPDNQVRVAIGYGKRPIKRVYGLDNFWETLASPEREGQEMEDDKLESIPMDWFVNEIVNNPDFARSVLRKFVDLNQDGMLSSDELLRNV